MTPINLSYVLTTRNKLPYLKETLAALIEARQADEEILVADGGSTDGTGEYLKKLYDQKKIDYMISEPDKGESHGFNKLMAVARGTLIKIITDDDAFYYPGIAECKEFMLAHPEIDFLSTDGVKCRDNPQNPFPPMVSKDLFVAWQRTRTPFTFCGLGIMIRKSSLPLLGYLHTGFIRTDAEYALRVTASKANLAWYTGICFVHILNPRSNSLTYERRMIAEMESLDALYLGKRVRPAWEKKLRGIARDAKRLIGRTPALKPVSHEEASAKWQVMYRSSLAYLADHSSGNQGEFLS